MSSRGGRIAKPQAGAAAEIALAHTMPHINIEAQTFSFDDGPEHDLPADTQAHLRRIALLAFGCLIAVEVLVVLILLWLFPLTRPDRPPGAKVKTLVVLGSGGHTAEMLKLVGSLDKQVFNPRVYVAASTDALSSKKAVESEKSYQPDGKAQDCEVFVIPRSREVGQSYFTSIFTTLRSLIAAAVLVWQVAPDVIMVNGPGTCIPICAAAYLYRRLWLKYCDIIYVESIARVKSLSLSGRILYKSRMADMFLVQWEALQRTYPRAKFVDRLY